MFCLKKRAGAQRISSFILLFNCVYYLIGGILLCSAVLVSALRQCSSAKITHVSPPSWASLPSPDPAPLGHHRDPPGLLVLYSNFLPAICLTRGSVYMSRLLFPFVLPSPSPTASTGLLSISVSPLLPYKQVHWYHFSRFHIYALIYNTCFSLSDLLHSVWQVLGSSTSQELTRICFFMAE